MSAPAEGKFDAASMCLTLSLISRGSRLPVFREPLAPKIINQSLAIAKPQIVEPLRVDAVVCFPTSEADALPETTVAAATKH